MLEDIPADKLSHFLVGATIGFSLSIFIPFLASFIIVLIVGAGKEAYDYFHPDKHSCDVFDFLATALGGLYMVALYLLHYLKI